jgi:hypothetical protein
VRKQGVPDSQDQGRRDAMKKPTIVDGASLVGGVAVTLRSGSGAFELVQQPPQPQTKADCKNGGYKEFGFKNQGRCIAFVNRAAKDQEQVGDFRN